MKALKAAALLTVLLSAPAQTANAQLAFFCEECRNVSEHPIDAANFALNATLGPDPFIFGGMADEFDVVDLSGNRVTVDVNFSYLDGWVFPVVIRRVPFLLPVPRFNFSGRAILQAIVRDSQRKMLLNLKIQSDKVRWPLKVGGVDGPLVPPRSVSTDGGDGGNGGGSEDDAVEGGDVEYDGYDYGYGYDHEPETGRGVVEIVDPDEEGEFPDWLEEL